MQIKNGLILKDDFKFSKGNISFTDKITGFDKECENDVYFDADGCYVIPGLIDTHMHAAVGETFIDFTPETAEKICAFSAKHGTTTLIPTLSAAREEKMISAIKYIVGASKNAMPKCAKILGIHLEGPFLSPERIGAQALNGISKVDLDLMGRLWKASKGNIINMTVAPELKGMRELALYCIKKGIVLQAGHTNATYDQMIEGMQANIMHITHLFDAMRPMHHREPGVVGAALIHPEISCEIIGDGVHVNPNLIHLLMKSKPLNQIVLITDALPPAKTTLSPDSELYLDKVFYRKKDNVINGSAISMLDGVQNLISYGIPLEKIIKMASTNPAQIMKQPDIGLILPGKKADLLVMDADLNIKHTIINGKIIKEK